MDIRALVVTISLLSAIILQGRADGQQGKAEQPAAPEAVQAHVLEVFDRNARRLEKDNPDVLGIVPDPGNGTIWIVTDRPTAVPTQIGDVPVTIKPAPPHLPPPPGVIILKPGGVQEAHPEMQDCPQDYAREMRRYRWRFCQSTTGLPQPIPAPMAPPIAGIPFPKVKEIVERHRDELGALPGVTSVGIGADGILVETNQPELLPSIVEGLPIKSITRPGQIWRPTNHTKSSSTTPFHGGVAGKNNNEPTSVEPFTLGGVVLSQGKPWVVGAGHAITASSPGFVCGIAPCDLTVTTLNLCPHYPTSPLDIWQQSPASNPQMVARMSKWDLIQSNTSITDAAAGFVDNDTIDGNGSLSVDRQLTGLPIGMVTKFSGLEIDPMFHDYIYIVSAISSVSTPGCGVSTANHVNPGRIEAVDVEDLGGGYPCQNNTSIVPVNRKQLVQYITNFNVLNGTSGSLVLHQTSGAVVAMATLGGLQCLNQSCSQYCPVNEGRATIQSRVKSLLGYDAWYGTESVKDNTIGVFRTNTATWYVDNGNGKLDSTPCTIFSPTTTRDQCFGYGATTDVPVTGDWDNSAPNSPSNDFTVGVYRPTGDPTYFFLSNTNIGPTAAITMPAGPSSFSYRPVTGKWQGSTTANNLISKVGVFRPSTGSWYLDSGNFNSVDGCGIDYCFFLAAGMYQSGDTPIAGDWNNDGVVTIEVFRRGVNGGSDFFYLSDINPFTVRNNGTISSWTYSVPGGPGSFGYLPLTGNWTGTVGTKLGVFRPASGGWYLDNGNRVFASCSEDQCPAVFGGGLDKPVAFGKSIVKGN